MWQTTSARAVYCARKRYYYFKWLLGKVTIFYITFEKPFKYKLGFLELLRIPNALFYIICLKQVLSRKNIFPYSALFSTKQMASLESWNRRTNYAFAWLMRRYDTIYYSLKSVNAEQDRDGKKSIPNSNEINLSVKKFRLSTRKYFLTVSSIRPWNSFSEEVVEASWLESLKPILDKTLSNVLQGTVLCWQGLEEWLMDCLQL